MDLPTIITIAMGVMMAARILLIYVAPLTKTLVDDRITEFLTKALEVLSLHVAKK